MRVIKLGLLFTLLLLTLIACDSDTSTPLPPTITLVPTNTPAPTNTPLPISTPIPALQTVADNPSEQANIRFVNAGTDLPPISVEIQGLTFASNLAFGGITLPSGIVAGDYEMILSNSEGTISQEHPMNINGRDNLIVMFTGTTEALAVSVYHDDITPLASGQTRINFIHAVNRAPSITLQESNIDLTTPIEFGQASNAFTIESRPVTLFFQSGTETLSTLPITLTELKSYTYILAGDYNDPESIRLISFDTRVPAISNLRFINALADVGTVDVYFDSELVASGIEPTRMTERQEIGAQAYEVTLYSTGSDPLTTEPIATQQVNIRHNHASLVLMGNANDTIQLAYFEDDLTMTSANEARVRFINTVADIPNVSVVNESGESVEGIPSLLTYGQATRNTNLPSETYTFFWARMDNSESNEFVEIAENVILEAGRSYLYLFTAQDTNTPLIFSENVGADTAITLSDLDETITVTQPTGPTRIRFVHAIDSAPLINVFVDDLELGTLLPYRATIDYLIIPAGFHTISLRDETNTQFIGAVEFEFEEDTDYSVYAYGFETYGFEVAVVEDNIQPQQDRSLLRLINLSQEDNTELGLRYIESLGLPPPPQVEEQPDLDATEEVEPEASISRPSIFSGTQSLTELVDSAQATSFGVLDEGSFDFIVIDYLNRIASTFYNLAIEPNKIYELIVYEDIFSSEVRGFVLEIPQP